MLWCGTIWNWDAFAGHLYLFFSRRKDRLKILYWDRDGFAIWTN
jgi:transposase